jgi:hypothetical protein
MREAMTIVGKKPPCKDCTDRTVGCHSKCKKYIEWKNKDIQVKEANRGVIWAKDDIIAYKISTRLKNDRRRKK